MTLTERSLMGALFIGAIILLRAAAKERLPRWALPALWWAAILRLLVPTEWSSAVSIRNLWPMTGSIIRAGSAAAIKTGSGLSLWTVLWSIGFALCIAVFFAVWRWNMGKFRESLPAESDRISRWLEGHRLGRPIQVRKSDRLDSPLTYGLFRPVVLLPSGREWTDCELECILTHEFVHICHWDCLTKLLALLCAALHWFNPLVWCMVVLINRDLEFWCDSSTVAALGGEHRADYALTLIRLEEQRTFLPSVSAYFTTNPVKERIRSVMKGKKFTPAMTAFALLLVIGVSSVFATSASAADSNDHSVGVIGGYDGPTTIFVTQSEESTDDVKFQFLDPETGEEVEDVAYELNASQENEAAYQEIEQPADEGDAILEITDEDVNIVGTYNGEVELTEEEGRKLLESAS